MLTLTGTLLNVLRRDPRPESANQFTPYGQAQLQTEEVLDDGQVKIGLQTLSFDIPSFEAFKAMQGREVQLAVRVYVKGTVAAFALQGGATPLSAGKAS